MRSKNEELESQISGRNTTVQNLEQRLIEMEELSEQSKADSESARSTFEAELSAAQEEQRVAETNAKAANERVKATESELMDLRSRIENFEAQSQEKENLLQEEARAFRVKIEELENAERELERQVMEAKENLSDAETRAKSSEVQVGNLQLQIEEARKEHAKTLNSLTIEKDALLVAKNSLENEVDALKDTVASSTNMLRQKEMESEAQMVALQNEKLRAEIQKQRVELEDTSMKLPFSVDAKFIVTFDLPSNQFLVLTGSWCEWKVSASEEMMCANKKTWTKEVPLGLDVTHEYKYLICERDSNGEPKQVEWQNGSNSMFGASSGALRNMRGDLEIHDSWIPNPSKNPVFLFSKSGGKFETDRQRMLQDCLDAQTYGHSQNYTSHIVDDMYSALGGDSTYEPQDTNDNNNTQAGGGQYEGGDFNVVDDGFGENIRKSYEHGDVDTDEDGDHDDFIVIDIV